MTNRKPLILLAGPTAVGKTSSSIALAKRVGGEIISADSMQVYRGMDIGSAKVKKEEMQGVPHHLIDVIDPKEPFHVVAFQKLAKEAIDAIHRNGRIPILVGGTGFYLQSVLYDVDFTEHGGDPCYRQSLYELAEEKGPAVLHAMLREVDPESAERIPENNVKRVARALEYYRESGERISSHNDAERQKESPYDFRFFVLTMERPRLYERIGERVDKMMADGLLEEVRRLKEYGCTADMTSMQGLGYKQILKHLNGLASLEEAVQEIKTETRHFAKRQLTWFRREPDAVWVDVEKENLLDVYETRHF